MLSDQQKALKKIISNSTNGLQELTKGTNALTDAMRSGKASKLHSAQLYLSSAEDYFRFAYQHCGDYSEFSEIKSIYSDLIDRLDSMVMRDTSDLSEYEVPTIARGLASSIAIPCVEQMEVVGPMLENLTMDVIGE